MSGFETALQTAVYNRLTSQLTGKRIYDVPPNQPDGMPLSNFPYITIGDDTHSPFDADDTLGMSATITLHVWSRADGKKETKELQGLIYTALNRQSANLSATGFTFIDCLHEFSEVIEEVDGKTRHGVSRYRIIMEKN